MQEKIGPHILFISGIGDSQDNWNEITNLLSEACRKHFFCKEQRAVFIENGARSAEALADCLGPFVDTNLAIRKPEITLVGHSFGGLIAAAFAIKQSEKISSLILVDPSHPLQFEYMKRRLDGDDWEKLKPLVAQNSENVDFLGSRIDLERLSFLTVPTVLISHGKNFSLPKGFFSEDGKMIHDKVLNDLQVDWAKRFPHIRHIIAENSEHYIQRTEPELIVREIIRAIAKKS